VQLEIRFEAAAAEKAEEAAVGQDEHPRSRFAVGGTCRRDHGGKNPGFLSGGHVIQEQFETRVEAHVAAGSMHWHLYFKTAVI
jgi:hypothetical protein